MKRVIWIVIALFSMSAASLWWQSRGAETAVAETAAGAAEFVYSEPEGHEGAFARATEPGAISFPEDLGPHHEYQTEWWYYTGNLEGEGERPFGYQLTFFRRALVPDSGDVVAESPWRSNHVYFAHFAVSDIGDEQFYGAERFSRGAAGLAGAQAVPYGVWLEDWSAREVAPGIVQLYAETDEVTLDLLLTETIPPVLQGDRGLSAKGAAEGNASYYYSIVQQRAEGTITIGETEHVVQGLSWKDHEYSTSVLEDGVFGWDWFSMQFEDGTALMLYDLRQDSGERHPYAGGSFINADGSVQPLKMADFEITVLDEWTSPETGTTYPSAWRLEVPDLEIVLEGRPLMAAQELLLSTTYWEGATEFTGTKAGIDVTARGYVEMTGYQASMAGRL